MVDYKKWDRIAADLSESDDNEEGPQATSFDGPQSVTWGPDGVIVSPSSASKPASASKSAKPVLLSASKPATPSAPETTVMAVEPPLLDVASSGVVATNGGLVGERYVWSQTPEDVTVHIFVDSITKASEMAIEISETRLSVCRKSAGHLLPLLQGDWYFAIAPEEDQDWEVLQVLSRRAVRIAVRKKPALVDGLRVWWRCVLKGEPSIDVGAIQGRRKGGEAFGKAWEEAHARFREKASQRQPIQIDFGDRADAPDEPMEQAD